MGVQRLNYKHQEPRLNINTSLQSYSLHSGTFSYFSVINVIKTLEKSIDVTCLNLFSTKESIMSYYSFYLLEFPNPTTRTSESLLIKSRFNSLDLTLGISKYQSTKLAALCL